MGELWIPTPKNCPISQGTQGGLSPGVQRFGKHSSEPELWIPLILLDMSLVSSSRDGLLLRGDTQHYPMCYCSSCCSFLPLEGPGSCHKLPGTRNLCHKTACFPVPNISCHNYNYMNFSIKLPWEFILSKKQDADKVSTFYINRSWIETMKFIKLYCIRNGLCFTESGSSS